MLEYPQHAGEAYMMLESVVALAIWCNEVVGSPVDGNVPKAKKVKEADEKQIYIS